MIISMDSRGFFLWVLLALAFGLVGNAQTTILGGSAHCITDGDPDNITGLQSVNMTADCIEAFDTVARQWYRYDPTQSVGSRWIEFDKSSGGGGISTLYGVRYLGSTPQSHSFSDGDSLVFKAGGGLKVSGADPVSGFGVEYSHDNTSTLTANTDLINLGGYIKQMQVDDYGHAISLTVADLCEDIENRCEFLTEKTVTIQGDLDGTSGSGSFDIIGKTNQTIEISHANTSNLNGQYGSSTSQWHINSIDLDHYGHVSGVTVTGQSTTSYGTLSDINLKTNIEPISSALSKVLSLRGVNYTWKDSKRDTVAVKKEYGNMAENGVYEETATVKQEHIGVIAQEIEKQFPEAVYTDPETGLKSVEYGKLVAPLIEAVKEQQKQIDELRSEIEKLKTE